MATKVADIKSRLNGECDYSKAVEEFKENCKVRGEDIVKNVFPRKVVFLQKLLDSSEFSLVRLKELKEKSLVGSVTGTQAGGDATSTRKRKRPSSDTASAVGNAEPVICDLTDKVKPEYIELLEYCTALRLWIVFQIPKIEDGNNFGVAVQEEALGIVTTAENDVSECIAGVSKYHLSRGKIMSKILKYPDIDDYKQAILELDEKQLLSMRLQLCELRNHYSSMHDAIIKNIDKIKKPRNPPANLF